MAEHHKHIAMIHDMTGWEPVNTAPPYTVVTVMDHAGNVTDAIREVDGWKTRSFNGMMNGLPIAPRKWKPTGTNHPQ